ncbi:MAG: single-stranded DNA-binding protein [Spirochaetes bacterium]|jgi:single-strand DNA-binding protein|nr:single-stranded DNA-binding protein [Spirochaetota bacterium]
MASDLNKVILIGRMVRDPELRYTQNGSAVSSFSLANNRTYTASGEKKEIVSFFDCVAWGKTGEVIVQYCKKGHRIGIEGRLQSRNWEDQNGNKRKTVEIVIDNFQFLTPKDSHGESVEVPHPTQEPESNPYSDEDIPF